MENNKVKRKTITIISCIFLLSISFSATATKITNELNDQTIQTPLNSYNGNTLYVGGSGPGNYTAIQEAIDDAEDGDTVFVYDDSSPYFENVEMTHSVNLIGENRDSTMINGQGVGIVIKLYRINSITISGFTISGSGNTDEDMGISISQSDSITLLNNRFCNNNNIGIFVTYSNNNMVVDNIVEDNSGVGIYFKYDCDNNEIAHNIVNNNEHNGIALQGRTRHNSVHNNIISNNRDGFSTLGSDYNEIYYNVFVDNDINAKTYSFNEFDQGYPLGGNYWSDYEGEDYFHGINQDIYGPDGIGDTPCELSSSRFDRYPLMNPKIGTFYGDAKGPYYMEVDGYVHFIGFTIGGTSPYSWHWDFGDGFTTEVQNPTHQYSKVGHYYATLTITDADEKSITDIAQVYITHPEESEIHVSRLYNLLTPGWQIDHFNNIQDAIDVSGDNGIVHVEPGIYKENIAVHRPITVRGQNKHTTIIQGKGKMTTVSIYADQVTFEGFTITNSGDDITFGAGLQIDNAENVIVQDNIIKNHPQRGIVIRLAYDCNIANNLLINNKETGILIHHLSERNTIENNKIFNSKIGIYTASSFNKIIDNKICLSKRFAISIVGHYNTYLNNIVMLNPVGLRIASSHSNNFARNTFAFNTVGIYFGDASENTFFENNLINLITGVTLNSKDNYWIHNYWKRPRVLPKVMIGLRFGEFGFSEFSVEVDLIPSKIPFLTPIEDFPEDPFNGIEEVSFSSNNLEEYNT